MAIEACEALRAVGGAVPESLVMTIQACAVAGLDGVSARLPGVDTKLDQAAHPDPAAHRGVIAAGSVASFAAPAFQFVLGLELKQAAHFGLAELE